MAPGIKTGGRKAGTPNKATADVRALAQEYTELGIWTLGQAMILAEDWGVRCMAAKTLLERGHGTPRQIIEAVVKPVYGISDEPLTPAEWAKQYATEADPICVASPTGAAKGAR